MEHNADGGADQQPLRLPAHFAYEQRRLEEAGIRSWQQLAALDDHQLRPLAGPIASEQRLSLLRGQARLVSEAQLEPAVAALLLHAGIDGCSSLAAADPQALLVQVGRLQRRLLGAKAPPVNLATVQGWILRARRGTN